MIGFNDASAAHWYCCNASPEFNMLIAVSDAQAGINPFILEDVYGIFWEVWGEDAAAARRAAFETTYGVTHIDELIDGVEVPVALLDLTFWTPFWLWRFTTSPNCDDGCFITNFYEGS